MLVECIELIAPIKVYRSRQLQGVGCGHSRQTIIDTLVVVSDVVSYDGDSAIDLLQHEIPSLKELLERFAAFRTLLAVENLSKCNDGCRQRRIAPGEQFPMFLHAEHLFFGSVLAPLHPGKEHAGIPADYTRAAWTRTYGTLGHGQPPWVPGAPQDAKGFWEAVERAAGLLALYEGVLNRDSQSVQRALLKEFPYMGIWWSIYDEPPAPPADHGLMDLEFLASQIAEYVEELYDGDYLGYTLKTVADEVERMVGTLCRPVLVVEEGSHDPSEVTAQWRFKSLLGAMYLQMYWLMAAGSELTRCENCGRLISLARPSPESRKRRRDKRFCDDACRQAHHRSKKKS